MSNMQQKLSQLISEVKAFSETYKAEIAAVPRSQLSTEKSLLTCEEEIDGALAHLEDAMYEINHADDVAEEEDGETYEEHMSFECRQGNFV